MSSWYLHLSAHTDAMLGAWDARYERDVPDCGSKSWKLGISLLTTSRLLPGGKGVLGTEPVRAEAQSCLWEAWVAGHGQKMFCVGEPAGETWASLSLGSPGCPYLWEVGATGGFHTGKWHQLTFVFSIIKTIAITKSVLGTSLVIGKSQML